MEGLAISLVNISKKLNHNFAIKNISLTVKKGEFFCILGPSGSGKSTILGLIGGWHYPDNGEIFFCNENFTKTLTYKRPIRTCFQKGGFLFPHMTVRENIGYALKIKGINTKIINKRVEVLLSKFGLDGYSDRKVTLLSGGESQRVAIARAIADPQPILLFDEIETGLDKKLRRSIREHLLEEANTLGSTSIYVTHDSSEALGLISRLNTRLAIINDGELEQVGNANDIYYSPKSSFVGELTGETNLLKINKISKNIITTKGNNVFYLNTDKLNNEKYLFFRPEVITFDKPNEQYAELECNVVNVEFLGQNTRIIVQSKGDNLNIIRPSNFSYKKLNIGQVINCYIPMNSIKLLNK